MSEEPDEKATPPAQSRLARLSKFEPVPGVRNLDQARRLITHLLEQVDRLQRELSRDPGQYMIGLSARHEAYLQILFKEQQLVYDRKLWLDDPHIETALSYFVEQELEVFWDTYELWQEEQNIPHEIIPKKKKRPVRDRRKRGG